MKIEYTEIRFSISYIHGDYLDPQYIDHNYKQKLTVMELASQIQMSEGHFSRFFKSLVRMTPMEYINTTRINKACTLLQKSDRKMLDIAMDVGFQNQSYFIRLFKKQKGCTPREYRFRHGDESGICEFKLGNGACPCCPAKMGVLLKLPR